MKKTLALLTLTIISLGGCSSQPEKAETIVNGSSEYCQSTGQCYEVGSNRYKGTDVGDQIPNLTLYKVDGKTDKLYDLLNGKSTFVVSFVADWCGDCLRQNQKLEQYYKNLSENVGVITVFVDYDSPSGIKTKSTNEKQMIEYIKNNKSSYPMYYDKGGKIAEILGGIKATPTNFVLDQNGLIKIKAEEVDIDKL